MAKIDKMRIPEGLFQLRTNKTDYDCNKDIRKAAVIATTGRFKGEYIGYRGGPCRFIEA